MWRMFSSILAALVVGTLASLILFPAFHVEGKQPGDERETSGVSTYKINNENQAITSIQELKENPGIKDHWATTTCVWYQAYETDKANYIVEIREKHTEGCPGDPLTNPLAATFKIEKSTGSITWYDIQADEFLNLTEYVTQWDEG